MDTGRAPGPTVGSASRGPSCSAAPRSAASGSRWPASWPPVPTTTTRPRRGPTDSTPSGHSDYVGRAQPRGGNLRIGMVGNGTAETMDPGLGVVPIDASRAFNHFEGLVWVDQQNVLAAPPCDRVEHERGRDRVPDQAA